MRQLKIDPEFRDKVPPMTESEFQLLEENILKDGRVKVPITAWNNTIVDGHNRYAIVQKHPEIPFEVEEENFADRYEAIVWICKNQLGRRNLTDEQKTYLIGKQYEAQKKTAFNTTGMRNADGTYAQGTQNEHLGKPLKTAEVIAKAQGIGRETVRRAEKFAKGVDLAESVAPGIKQKILSGKVNVPKTVIASIPKMGKDRAASIVEAIKTGKPIQTNETKKGGYNPDGYTKEQRIINETINKTVAEMYDQNRPVERNVDTLLEDLGAIITDFTGKAKRSIQNYSTVLQEDVAKEKVIAALSEAETAIGKIKELIL